MAEDHEECDIDGVEKKVQEYLSKSKNNTAIKFLLKEPPVFTKDEDIKRRYAQCVFNAMKNIRNDKIPNSVSKLDSDQLDVLMKYVYRGLENETKRNAAFLKWHAEITKKAGVGCIVRMIADRKTV